MSRPDPNPPHLHAEGSATAILWTVVLSLLPAVFVTLLFFRFEAFRILVVALASALLAEMGMRRLFKKKATLYDGSSVVTATLLALLLPPTLPSWEVALGAAFAAIFGKEIFGGLGQNPFNPALVGSAFLLAAFPLSTASSGSAPLPLAWAILGGGVILLLARIIRWEIPLLYLGGVWMVSTAWGIKVEEIFFSGTILLAAFFLVTDPVTTPLTRGGERWFALGSGLLTALIRQGAGPLEGVTYGILIMNALNPWLDHGLRPRPHKTL